MSCTWMTFNIVFGVEGVQRVKLSFAARGSTQGTALGLVIRNSVTLRPCQKKKLRVCLPDNAMCTKAPKSKNPRIVHTSGPKARNKVTELVPSSREVCQELL